jgi:translocation and assembly module TamB
MKPRDALDGHSRLMSPRVSVESSYDNVNDTSNSPLGNLGADVRWRMEFE